MDLNLNADDLNTCVQCGLCLPHCPTYRVSGDETMSPRGRIALMREVQNHGAPVSDEIVDAFATCVQCRGCEPACPSSVPYGRLIEQTRETLVGEGKLTPKWQQAMLKPLAKPALLRAGSTALAVAGKIGPLGDLLNRRLGLPEGLAIRQPELHPSGDDVWMFTGCVMDAWQRDVHQATQTVLEAAGFGVRPTGDAAPCCGALHAHAGMGNDTRELANRTITALTERLGDKPIIVNSAGCGAAMKDYGHLIGTDEARQFSARVYDACEFLADHTDSLPTAEPLDLKVAIQDPCHLRHVQKAHQATRTVLKPFVRELVELNDDGLCCGAGGAYSVLQPELAGQIRTRKVAAIDRVSPDVVASANPGCSMHLSQAGVPTRHPMDLVAQAIVSNISRL